jgi:alanyl-tRNA synthetase
MKQYADPRMHSAEHILNQTMVRLFGCGRCFSSHIEKKKSKCDYRFDRPLTDSEAEEIETRVNSSIRQNLPVTVEHISSEEAARLYDTARLPDIPGEKIRIVKIGSYDSVPCIGEHVQNTGQIGNFSITSRSFENGVLRIRFKVSTGPMAGPDS